MVEEKVKLDTLFAGALGIDTFDVRARSTACSPCGVRPLDVMLVLDRTGSMCQDHWGRYQSGCPDLENAKEGMRTFLSFFDSDLHWVGLAALLRADLLPDLLPVPAAAVPPGRLSADRLKARGTWIYSIGYDLDALNGGANECQSYTGADENPPITAYSALQQIASGPDKFYDKPDPGQLRTIFTQVASDIRKGASALIDDSVQ